MAPVYCPECGFDNEETRASCLLCYASLVDTDTGEVCTQCGTDNAGGSKFCRGCGNQLDPMGTKAPTQKELGGIVLESMSGGALLGHGAAAEEEEEDFAPLAGPDEFEVADIGPAPAAAAAPAAPAAPPAAAAAVAPPPLPVEEEELPPPRVPTGDEVDMGSLGPPPPPPPPPPAAAATPPPPPAQAPQTPPPQAPQTPPPPPDTFELMEDEQENEFVGWELDTGEEAPDIGP